MTADQGKPNQQEGRAKRGGLWLWPVDRSERREDSLSQGAQLVAAAFCRDVIYDELTGEVSIIRIVERVATYRHISKKDSIDRVEAPELTLVLVMNNVPQLWEAFRAVDEAAAETDDDPAPPPEIAVDFKIYYPDGALSAHGTMLLHPVGRLGFASAHVGIGVSVSGSGVLSAEFSYLGKHLTTAMLEIEEHEVDLDYVDPGE